MTGRRDPRPLNPIAIALGKWFPPYTGLTYATTRPLALAFDGANIWAANNDTSTVSKIRTSDGTVLGTSIFVNYPKALAFDGANIWIASFTGNTLSKARASDATILGTYNAGAGPLALAYDGAFLWVANQGSNNVTKLRQNDGTVVGTYSVGQSHRASRTTGRPCGLRTREVYVEPASRCRWRQPRRRFGGERAICSRV